MQVQSSVKMNLPRIKQLTQAAVTALEMTAEALHTEVVQAQVMPFDSGHLEEDATFVDYGDSRHGRVRLVSSTPYARRPVSYTHLDVYKRQASEQVPFGIYAIEKQDYAELRCDKCKSVTQLKSLTRQFKAQGFKVHSNGR